MNIEESIQSFAIAVFVKTPELSPIKTRLSQSTSKKFSDEFYKRSVKITEEVVSCTQEQFINVCPYWAIAEEKGLDSTYWSGFEKIWQGDGDLGDRLFQVYRALKKRHHFVLLIGADSPLIRIDHFSDAFESLRTGTNFVLGPAYDGGFYLFGGSLDLPKMIWKNIHYSSSSTNSQLKNQLTNIGSIKELEPIWDIDTKDSIYSMLKTNSSKNFLLPAQVNFISWLSSFQV